MFTSDGETKFRHPPSSTTIVSVPSLAIWTILPFRISTRSVFQVESFPGTQFLFHTSQICARSLTVGPLPRRTVTTDAAERRRIFAGIFWRGPHSQTQSKSVPQKSAALAWFFFRKFQTISRDRTEGGPGSDFGFGLQPSLGFSTVFTR